jgi:hypothetical protein
LTIYYHSTEHDQELLRHRGLLQEAEGAITAKAREHEEFQVVKAQKIAHLQEELQDYEEEVQEHEFELTN